MNKDISLGTYFLIAEVEGKGMIISIPNSELYQTTISAIDIYTSFYTEDGLRKYFYQIHPECQEKKVNFFIARNDYNNFYHQYKIKYYPVLFKILPTTPNPKEDMYYNCFINIQKFAKLNKKRIIKQTDIHQKLNYLREESKIDSTLKKQYDDLKYDYNTWHDYVTHLYNKIISDTKIKNYITESVNSIDKKLKERIQTGNEKGVLNILEYYLNIRCLTFEYLNKSKNLKEDLKQPNDIRSIKFDNRIYHSSDKKITYLNVNEESKKNKKKNDYQYYDNDMQKMIVKNVLINSKPDIKITIEDEEQLSQIIDALHRPFDNESVGELYRSEGMEGILNTYSIDDLYTKLSMPDQLKLKLITNQDYLNSLYNNQLKNKK